MPVPVWLGGGCVEKITPDYTKCRFILKVFKKRACNLETDLIPINARNQFREDVKKVNCRLNLNGSSREIYSIWCKKK